MRVTKILGFFCTIIPFTLANTHSHHWGRRHQEISLRARGDVDVHKRDSFSNSRFTYYDVGLGACGQYSSPSDFIVALNSEQYGGGSPGPLCFLPISISYGGKTASAVIMDECMGCPYGGLDFSTGLFNYFASQDEGVIYGAWSFDGADQTTASSSSTPSPTPTPSPSPPTTSWTPPPDTSTSSTPSWTPSTTWTPTSTSPPYTPTVASTSTTSTSSTPSTTSQKSTETTTSSSSSTTTYPSGVATTSGTIPTIAPSSSPQNLLAVNACLIELGSLLVAAQQG